MISIASDILNLGSPVFQPDLERPDISRFVIKSLDDFIEKMPLLRLLVEFKETGLLDETLAGFGIGPDDKDLRVLLAGRDEGVNCLCPIASDAEG